MDLLGKVYNYLTIGIIFLLASPTLSILVSWNALPGDRLYPLKRGLEKVALKIVGPSFQAHATLRSKLIDRRFGEARTLLTRTSAIGLSEFTAEMALAKEEMIQAKSQERDPEAVRQEVKKLVAQLTSYHWQFEEQKQTLTPWSARPSPRVPRIHYSPQPSLLLSSSPKPYLPPAPLPPVLPSYLPQVPAPPDVSPPPPEVVKQIEKTQEEIDQTIKELEELSVMGTPSEEVTPPVDTGIGETLEETSEEPAVGTSMDQGVQTAPEGERKAEEKKEEDKGEKHEGKQRQEE